MASVGAWASGLSLIPTLPGDTGNSGRAITPDGQFVVGISSLGSATRGFLYRVGHDGATNVLSSDNAQATSATGVGYRTYNSQVQLIVSGLTTSGMTDWMTTDGGQTWDVKRRMANYGTAPWAVPAANGLGASITTDIFYDAFRDNVNYLRLEKMWGAWPPSTNVGTMTIDAKSVPTSNPASINGVSASGRAVGYRQSGSGSATRQNYVMDTTGGFGSGTVFFFNGLDGTTLGEAHAVSADGSVIFGRSPTLTNSTERVGYKALFSGQTQLSIERLPMFGDEGGSTSLQIPYGCTPDGKIAVGMDYRGMEKAVLWDTSDPNPANWWVLDLTSQAAGEGILGGFIRLSRAYSVGIDPNTGERVITGEGIWSPDGGATLYTRAFVMNVIPEPGSTLLLGLGALMFLFRLRRR